MKPKRPSRALSRPDVFYFGPYRGATIEQVAETHRGLLYLDRIAGEIWLRPTFRVALDEFLGRPGVTKRIDYEVDEDQEEDDCQ